VRASVSHNPYDYSVETLAQHLDRSYIDHPLLDTLDESKLYHPNVAPSHSGQENNICFAVCSRKEQTTRRNPFGRNPLAPAPWNHWLTHGSGAALRRRPESAGCSTPHVLSMLTLGGCCCCRRCRCRCRISMLVLRCYSCCYDWPLPRSSTPRRCICRYYDAVTVIISAAAATSAGVAVLVNPHALSMSLSMLLAPLHSRAQPPHVLSMLTMGGRCRCWTLSLLNPQAPLMPILRYCCYYY
jgi:hypothetical protein